MLIERGHEVGGGDQRVDTGTIARLVRAEQLPDGRWLAVFAGTEPVPRRRMAADDPYPQAEVEDLPEPEWDPARRRPADGGRERWSARRWRWPPSWVTPRCPAGFELSDRPGAAGLAALCRGTPRTAGPPSSSWSSRGPLASARLVEAAHDAKRMLAFRLGGRIKIGPS